MVRFLFAALLVGCSAAAGESDLPAQSGGSAGAPTAAAGEGPTGGSTSQVAGAGGLVSEAGKAPDGGTVAKAGEPPIGGTGGAGGSAGSAPVGGNLTGGSGGAAAGAASAGSAGQIGSAGTATGGAGPKCPADFYCHELGPDAFAKCVTRPADPDPQFPGCTITEGTCFYPKDAPESCILDSCWSTKRTCD